MQLRVMIQSGIVYPMSACGGNLKLRNMPIITQRLKVQQSTSVKYRV